MLKELFAHLPVPFLVIIGMLMVFYIGYPFIVKIRDRNRYWDLRERQLMFIEKYEQIPDKESSKYARDIEGLINELTMQAQELKVSPQDMLSKVESYLWCLAGLLLALFALTLFLVAAGKTPENLGSHWAGGILLSFMAATLSQISRFYNKLQAVRFGASLFVVVMIFVLIFNNSSG